MSRVRLIHMVLLAATGAFTATAALAQPGPPNAAPTAEQLNPAEQVARQVRPRANDIFAAPEPGPCPLRDSALTFDLKSVTFSGVSGVKDKDIAAAYRNQVGKTIPVSEICDIRDRAAAILFSEGILARVEIPEQRIADGELKLEVIEARIANIRFHGDAGPAQAKIESYLERLRGMTPFDLDVAQRYLLLAADVPGVQISAAIRPSAQGRGAVDLDITASHSYFDIAVNAQNFGSEALGPWAGLVRGDVKSLTPWGDRTALVVYSTLDGKEQQVVQVISEFRPGSTGLIIRGSASYARTRPGGPLEVLELEGDASDIQLSANYPFIRSRSHNLNFIAGIDIADQKTDFADGGTLIDDKLRIGYLRAEGNARTRLLGLPINGDLSAEVRKGFNVLGASQASETTLSRAAGEPEALVARLEGHGGVGIGPWLEAYLGFKYQYADSPLLSYEQMSIGNLTIGRGYDPSSVAGDRGVAGAFELRLGPVNLPLGVRASAYGFYDIARTEFVDIAEITTVASTGGGLRFASPWGLDLDVFYANPLDKTSEAALEKPPGRVMVSVTFRR